MLLNLGMQGPLCSGISRPDSSNPFNFAGMEPFYQTAG